jgi:hypothetical protein
MKACASCAEQIQDAAILCKHCSRKQPSSDSSVLGKSSKRGLGIALGLASLLVLAGGATVGIEHRHDRQKAVQDSTAAADAAHTRQLVVRDSIENRAHADSAAHAREVALLDSIQKKAAADSAARAREVALHDAMLRAEHRAADSATAATPRMRQLLTGSNSIPSGSYKLIEFSVLPRSRCGIVGNATGSTGNFEALVLSYDQLVAWQSGNSSAQAVWRSGLTSSSELNVTLPMPGKYGLVLSNRAAWMLAHKVESNIQLLCRGVWPPPSNVEGQL